MAVNDRGQLVQRAHGLGWCDLLPAAPRPSAWTACGVSLDHMEVVVRPER
jgi:hypothetical protein